MTRSIELDPAATPFDTERAVSSIARYYDLDFGALSDDLELYANFAAGGSVLELGSGTGRVAAFLAERGCRVVAVERNEAMLAAGAERYQASGVRVRRADMRRLDFDAEFDTAICALSSFCHLQSREDQLATLRGTARALRPGGTAIIDLPALDAGDWEEGPRPLVHEWTRRHPVSGRAVSKLATLEAHPASQTQDLTYFYDEVLEDGTVERTIARFQLRHVFRFEMAGLLEASGMRVRDTYGSYDLGEPGAGDRLIVVAERPEEGSAE